MVMKCVVATPPSRVGSLGCGVVPRATLRGDAGLLSLGAALCACCLILTLVLRSPPGGGMLLAATLNCFAFGLLAFQQACGYMGWRTHDVCGECMVSAWRAHGVRMACAWRAHGVRMASRA